LIVDFRLNLLDGNREICVERKNETES